MGTFPLAGCREVGPASSLSPSLLAGRSSSRARARTRGVPHPLHSALRVGPAAGSLGRGRFRGEDPQLASYLRIEDRKLDAGGDEIVTQVQRRLSGELGTDRHSRPR